ncbi:MAG TPA: hypothetical protein VHL10_00815 [Nitrososphaera sp.]|nr:hypothetical protein [Nitrososphaera sp.]
MYSRCTNDTALMALATGGVWEGTADLGVVAPYVAYQQQASPDVNTMNAIRIFTRKTMQIKAVGPTKQYSILAQMAARIDTLFKDERNIPLAVGGILACYRTDEIAYPDSVNGESWSHIGGLYIIELQGS